MSAGYLNKKKNFNKKNLDAKTGWRVVFLKVFICIGALVIIGRLFIIQIVNGETYKSLASDQHDIYKNIFPVRGQIFVNELNSASGEKYFPLATNKEFYTVYAIPKLITEPESIAKIIYPILFKEEIKKELVDTKDDLSNNIFLAQNKDIEISDEFFDEYNNYPSYQKVLDKFKKENDPYEPLRSKAELSVVEKLDSLKIAGIKHTGEMWRYYPDGNIGSHFLGFTRNEGNDKIGQYGLEGYFNDKLTGTSGYLHTETSARGAGLSFGNIDFKEAKNGSDLYLTIDRALQLKTCEELVIATEKYKIDEGTIIIMQPKTGAILAMCSYPDFDPNKYNEVDDINIYNNPATTYTYEPGSIFKPITMSMAIDLDKVGPNTEFYNEGFIKVDKYTIRNVDQKVMGWQNMTTVLEKSLNTGAIFAAKQVGNQGFLDYVKNYNFDKATGIELNNEAVGNVSSLENLNDVYTFTASFGQGITVTPIQMITAFSAIVNNGELMKPYIVDRIVNYDGQVEKTSPQVVRQVISPRTSMLLKSMLVAVIDNGYSKKAGANGYYLGGKTGTAQVSDSIKGGYSKDVLNHSFIGFGPLEDPQFSILVKFNNPKDLIYAGDTAAPVFGNLAEFLLKYYEIAPTR
jgi:cell division protein FtsI/penicillin-binding protein 2